MRSMTTLVALLATAMAVGCEAEETGGADVASAEAPVEQPKAAKGEQCQTNNDCGDGLGCASNNTCQTYKTIECRGRETACKQEGRCTGSERGCIAASNADCEGSAVCEGEGRCTAQEGKCVVASNEDCQKLCAEIGRCTAQDGACVATSKEDCQASRACKKLDRCTLENGACVAKAK